MFHATIEFISLQAIDCIIYRENEIYVGLDTTPEKSSWHEPFTRRHYQLESSWFFQKLLKINRGFSPAKEQIIDLWGTEQAELK